MRLWDIRTGKCLKVWEFNTAVKRVEFSEDGTQLLAVTEKRMGFLGTIVVFDVKVDVDAEQTDGRSLIITCDESKATVAGWSYLSKYIIAGHEDGSVSQYDAKVTLSRLFLRTRALLISRRVESFSLTNQFMKTACKLRTSNGHLIGRISSQPPRTKQQRRVFTLLYTAQANIL